MYKTDRAWADTYESQVLSILKTLIAHLAVISIASDEIDKKYATDFEVKLSGGTIAVRLRKPCKYRDLTLRARRDSGVKTELAKIKEGYAYRYFYGWTDDQGAIEEWILVDLDKLRATHLLEKPLIDNHDGTYFIAVKIRELYDAGCLLDRQLKRKPRRVNTYASPEEGVQQAKTREYHLKGKY